MVYFYTFTKKRFMKAINVFAGLSLVLAMASCGGTEEKTEKVTFNLDAKASTLGWKGRKSAEYFHTGIVKITKGTIDMEGKEIVGGSFKLDMNTIECMDEMLPDDKKAMLNGHLKDTSFFFIAENPEITVTVADYKDGKLNVIINVLGLEIKQAIPVKVTATEKDVRIKGDFGVDVSALKLAGMQPDPASGEKINSMIDFQLDVLLKK